MNGTLTPEQSSTLAMLAKGRACPADVASVLDRIAAGRYVTGQDVYYVTRTREESRDFYARLRAAGADIPGGSGIPVTPNPEAYPRKAVTLATGIRAELQTAARALADALDRAAEMVAEADRAYVRALNW